MVHVPSPTCVIVEPDTSDMLVKTVFHCQDVFREHANRPTNVIATKDGKVSFALKLFAKKDAIPIQGFATYLVNASWQSENCTDCAVLPGCIHGYCNRPLECICEEGWTGEFCDTPICKEKCHPAYGSCDFPGACICSSGYQGELCDECRPYPGCEHGTCREPWTCNCEPGWEGTQCNIPRQEGRFIPSRNHEDFNYGGSNYQYQRGR
eukprot:TCALIF_12700-PA protein Name:"Similar to dla Delta-like protein A (Danio rerio)" AED:0.01 eAED:0.01 QI:399/0.83/0.85/1/0.33/0.42/7/242/207